MMSMISYESEAKPSILCYPDYGIVICKLEVVLHIVPFLGGEKEHTMALLREHTWALANKQWWL